ncbi:MAG: ABC transporter ATP-binding protein [Clostridiales bacterium]|nr:ABC transporter ATP-binding protein [Clostridiales bacterium]
MNNKSILSAENISFSYTKSKKVINEVSFSIESGKITALIGANGCGKSTLFQLLTGKLKPDSGKITLDGVNIEKIKRKNFSRIVAVVHQYNTAPSDLTVKKLVEMGRTPYKNTFSYKNSKTDRETVDFALEITDTKKYENEMISQLSGGQRQRVWLALALAQSPKILLLDEITTYLDIKYQYEILNLIKTLNQKNQLTVLMVLHDINQAIEFSDNTIIMKAGKILCAGKTDSAITKEYLDSAFGVNSQIARFDNKKYFIINNGKDEMP